MYIKRSFGYFLALFIHIMVFGFVVIILLKSDLSNVNNSITLEVIIEPMITIFAIIFGLLPIILQFQGTGIKNDTKRFIRKIAFPYMYIYILTSPLSN